MPVKSLRLRLLMRVSVIYPTPKSAIVRVSLPHHFVLTLACYRSPHKSQPLVSQSKVRIYRGLWATRGLV